jgi:hypothetical protein
MKEGTLYRTLRRMCFCRTDYVVVVVVVVSMMMMM